MISILGKHISTGAARIILNNPDVFGRYSVFYAAGMISVTYAGNPTRNLELARRAKAEAQALYRGEIA